MSYTYPYQSTVKKELGQLQEGQDYFVWRKNGFDLQQVVASLDAPIVEIGGPTDLGYFFLDDIQFRSRPVITNISENPLPHHPDHDTLAAQVDELVDGTNMPYEDNSAGIFLMSNMSLASDWWTILDDAGKERAMPDVDKIYDIAELEMGQVALGMLPPDKVEHAQIIRIYLEMRRTLRSGGLLFSNGRLEHLAALQRLGFEVVAYLQLHHRTSHEGYAQDYMAYEFVAQKR